MKRLVFAVWLICSSALALWDRPRRYVEIAVLT